MTPNVAGELIFMFVYKYRDLHYSIYADGKLQHQVSVVRSTITKAYSAMCCQVLVAHPWSTAEFLESARTFCLSMLTHQEYRVRIAAGTG